MNARLFMHLRRLPSGRFAATPVPFSDLSFDGDTKEDSRAQALAAATARLREFTGAARAALADEVEAELSSVRVSVAPEPSAERIELTAPGRNFSADLGPLEPEACV